MRSRSPRELQLLQLGTELLTEAKKETGLSLGIELADVSKRAHDGMKYETRRR